jgi:L-lactate dehydrogenase complex protein LldE
MLHLGDRQERLLSLVKGLSIAPFEQADQCCGFGGAFSVGHSTISTGIGLEKLQCIQESGAGTIVSGDMGCLMQLQGLIDRERLPLKTRHYAQILAEELD